MHCVLGSERQLSVSCRAKDRRQMRFSATVCRRSWLVKLRGKGAKNGAWLDAIVSRPHRQYHRRVYQDFRAEASAPCRRAWCRNVAWQLGATGARGQAGGPGARVGAVHPRQKAGASGVLRFTSKCGTAACSVVVDLTLARSAGGPGGNSGLRRGHQTPSLTTTRKSPETAQ